MINFVWYLGGLTELMNLISTSEITGNVIDPDNCQFHVCKAVLAIIRVIAVQTSYLVIMPPGVYRNSTSRLSGGSSGMNETSVVDLDAISINLGGRHVIALVCTYEFEKPDTVTLQAAC